MTEVGDRGVQYNDPDTREAVARYQSRFMQFARTPETLGWRPATQDVRFSAFYAGLQVVPGQTLLDIGCGFGDLLRFLRTKGWTGEYLGVDIVPEFIDVARQQFADDQHAAFRCIDFMQDGGAIVADVTFASGLLNHRRNDHEAYVDRFIQAAARASHKYMAIDFLSDTADRRREDLFFHDAGRILQFGLKISRRSQIDHAYMPFEFMLKLWFPDTTPADFPVF